MHALCFATPAGPRSKMNALDSMFDSSNGSGTSNGCVSCCTRCRKIYPISCFQTATTPFSNTNRLQVQSLCTYRNALPWRFCILWDGHWRIVIFRTFNRYLRLELKEEEVVLWSAVAVIPLKFSLHGQPVHPVNGCLHALPVHPEKMQPTHVLIC